MFLIKEVEAKKVFKVNIHTYISVGVASTSHITLPYNQIYSTLVHLTGLKLAVKQLNSFIQICIYIPKPICQDICRSLDFISSFTSNKKENSTGIYLQLILPPQSLLFFNVPLIQQCHYARIFDHKGKETMS